MYTHVMYVAWIWVSHLLWSLLRWFWRRFASSTFFCNSSICSSFRFRQFWAATLFFPRLLMSRQMLSCSSERSSLLNISLNSSMGGVTISSCCKIKHLLTIKSFKRVMSDHLYTQLNPGLSRQFLILVHANAATSGAYGLRVEPGSVTGLWLWAAGARVLALALILQLARYWGVGGSDVGASEIGVGWKKGFCTVVLKERHIKLQKVPPWSWCRLLYWVPLPPGMSIIQWGYPWPWPDPPACLGETPSWWDSLKRCSSSSCISLLEESTLLSEEERQSPWRGGF